MQYCNGGDLVDQVDHLRRRNQVMAEQFVLQIIIHLAEVLAYIHHGLRYVGEGRYTVDANHTPVIHGDIKDDNIFLTWPATSSRVGNMPDVVLGDFGAAKLVGARDTHTGIGTPGYHSPEDVAIYGNADWNDPSNRALFEEVVDRRTTASDIYAFGHVVYKLVAREKECWEIGRNPEVVSVSPEYQTAGLRELVVSCLAVAPAQRGEASFGERGFLNLIPGLRQARDELVKTRKAPGRREWKTYPA
jgi:NIMA (never in mitosis gene a)-related kinase